MRSKTPLILLIAILYSLIFISCEEKVICNYYIVGQDIYEIKDSTLKWKINSTNPISFYKFEIEIKNPPTGFAIPDYSELKTLVEGLKNCKQIDLPALFPNSVKLISKTDTLDYDGNKMLKGFLITESNGTIEIKDVIVDKGELVTILFKKL